MATISITTPSDGHKLRMSYTEILDKLVEKTESCWLWKGSQNSSGYGQHGSHKRPGAETLAHRKLYAMNYGPIPKGLQIDHLCREKLCVNPEHLEAVPPKLNLMRAPNQVTTLNARKTHCIHGHKFDKLNTRIHKSGKRECIQCKKERKK